VAWRDRGTARIKESFINKIYINKISLSLSTNKLLPIPELKNQLPKFGGPPAHYCSGGHFAEAQTSLLV
jgi:hypothetical protein